jgi:predicted oxidoreductase
MLQIADDAGANLVNQDRMWHYTEGLQNWDPIWPMHGIRVIPGPTSIWLDAVGKRLPPPYFPGCDTLGTLKAILNTGYEHTWFILDQNTIGKEFALSGSEQNPDLTGKDFWLLLKRLNGKGPEPVRNFQKHGNDFVTRDTLRDLVDGMNDIMTKEGGPKVQYDLVLKEIRGRDSQIHHHYAKDAQVMLINNARSFWPDRFTRIAKSHTLLDPNSEEPRANPAYGPLIAVRLNILTRKTLGGIQTNTEGQVISKASPSSILPGLYAAGEVNGFGGGGVHGYNALEGTFLGGCIFSGRAVGRTLASID